MSDKRRRLSTIMTKKHPLWNLFVMLLGTRLDYREDEHNGTTWNCDCTLDGAREILELMAMDVEKSIKYFEENGGYCDCEIMFNVVD